MTSAAAFEQFSGEQPQEGPWSDLAAPPIRPVHAAIARRLFMRAIVHLPVRVELPSGKVVGRPIVGRRIVGGGDADAPLMRIHDDRAFFYRLGASGLVGFGEAFMAGDWDADDPAGVLAPFAARLAVLVPAWMQRLRGFYVAHQPWREQNTLVGARRNIERHYDLSNDLFALFLDPSMTYSSGWFEPGDTLEQAQMRKVDRLLDAVGAGVGTRLLEVGTGWGALAVRAARRGATVTTLTLSREQQALAQRRAADAGVAERIDVQLRDYRDVEGTYDAIVSVEMVEAVGARFWPAYFAMLDRSLVSGGRVGIQAIVLAHDRMIATRYQYSWMHKYIFPGGALPSVRAIEDTLAAHTRLRVVDHAAFGASYASTLRCWRETFDANAEAVERLGFDQAFRRMWDFYLAYCEAGFDTGYLDVVQLVLAPIGD